MTLHTPVGMACSCGELVWSVEHAADQAWLSDLFAPSTLADLPSWARPVLTPEIPR